jgi:hypothetical protein
MSFADEDHNPVSEWPLGANETAASSFIGLITQTYPHCSVRAYLEACHIVRTSSLKAWL